MQPQTRNITLRTGNRQTSQQTKNGRLPANSSEPRTRPERVALMTYRAGQARRGATDALERVWRAVGAGKGNRSQHTRSEQKHFGQAEENRCACVNYHELVPVVPGGQPVQRKYRHKVWGQHRSAKRAQARKTQKRERQKATRHAPHCDTSVDPGAELPLAGQAVHGWLPYVSCEPAQLVSQD